MDKEICIIAGVNKDGEYESFGQIHLKVGETISVMGSTGSGKTALITDIELLSQGDSVTKRKILLDGKIPSDDIRYNPTYKPIAMISQNTKCFSDLFVTEFLEIHARARGISVHSVADETLNLANQFTGEAIKGANRVTELSGGQTRSLLIADAITIGAAPIILLDEIENAGINKNEIMKIVKSVNKLIIFVTHDPVVALQTEKRIVMKNGSIDKIISRTPIEEKIMEDIVKIDKNMVKLRNSLRAGEDCDYWFSDIG